LGEVGYEDLVKPTDGLVSRYLNRRISTRISMKLVRLRWKPSPDFLSVVSATIVGAGGLFFAAGYSLAGGLLAQIGSILDGCDGEVARLLGKQSRGGALLDTVLDRFADIVLLYGLAVASIGYLGELLLVSLVVAAVSGDLMVSYIHGVGEKIAGRHPSLIGRVRGVASRDVRLFVVFLSGLLGRAYIGLVVVAILSLVYTVAKTWEVLGFLGEQ